MEVYINKAELLKELSVIQDRPVSTAMKIIKELPTIDIVRCGECKYWDGIECQNDRASTDLEGGAEYALYRDDTDFCSYGERRADERLHL